MSVTPGSRNWFVYLLLSCNGGTSTWFASGLPTSDMVVSGSFLVASWKQVRILSVQRSVSWPKSWELE